MEPLEEVQEAIQKSKYGLTNYPKWLREGPRSTIDYIDLILDQESKLSSIITCFMCFNPELDIPMDFTEFGAAMKEYTDRIKKYTEEFYEHLKTFEAYKIEKARQG